MNYRLNDDDMNRIMAGGSIWPGQYGGAWSHQIMSASTADIYDPRVLRVKSRLAPDDRCDYCGRRIDDREYQCQGCGAPL